MTKDDPQDSYRISPENTVAWAVAARTLQAFSRGEVTEMLEHAAIRKPDGKIARKKVELFTWEKLDYVPKVKKAFGIK